MRYAKMLRRRADDTPMLAQKDFYGRVAAYIESLESALMRYRMHHDVICQGVINQACSCGADDYNKLIDNILADGEMDSQKRKYK